MADLSQTAANVALAGVGAQVQVVQVGEAVTQGMPGYRSSTDAKYYKAVNNDAAKDEAIGVFLTAAATDGYVVLQTTGDIDLGATLTVGETYVVSDTAGAIAPIGDLTTGQYVTTLGVASAADTLPLNINATGVAKA